MKKVFLIPHAGGLSTPYHNLGKSFPGYDFEVLHFKGRGHTYYEYDKLEFAHFIEMAYTEFRSKIKDDFIVLGHSFGALIGLELLKLYKKESKQNKALFISSSFTPPIKATENNGVKLSKLKNEDLLKHVESLGPIQEKIKSSKDSLDSFLTHIRGDFCLLDNYHAKEIEELPYPVLAMCGNKDANTPYELQSDWARFTSDDFELSIYDGKHFDLFNNQVAKDKIKDTLNKFFGDRK